MLTKTSQRINQDYPDTLIIQQRIANTQIVKKYCKGRLLGKGGFAKCYEFTSLQTKKLYAAKVIEKSSLTKPKSKEKLSSQIKIHKSLKFQYIVGFEHVFQDQDNVYILLQLCTNQTLNQLVKRRKRLTELEAQSYLYQIALAIKYMQSNKVIHRDLKLGNLFLNDKLEIKIGDFGLAAHIQKQNQKRNTMCGTPNYIAPQILENKNGHSYEVDIWSFGVIAYAILIGRPPFETSDMRSTYNKIRMCNYAFPQTISLSRNAKSLITKMLQLDPARRLTIDQILSHDFFNSNPFPKTLPISTLACPPNSMFLKKFNAENSQLRKSGELNTSRGFQKMDQIPLKRNQSTYQRERQMEITDRNQVNLGPQRAVSTLALNNYKYIVKKTELAQNMVENKGPQLWVTYCTFDPKFGLAYLLNGKISGMYFIDNTCIINSKNYNKSKYFELDQNFSEVNSKYLQKVQNNPKMEKKVKVINYFENMLIQKKEEEQKKLTNQDLIKRQRLRYKKDTPQNFHKVYIKRYINSKKGYIFLFSNKDIQFIFTDKTEILIKNQNAVYVNRYGERKNFFISQYQNMTQDIQKRVTYALKILKTFHNNQVKLQTCASKQNIQKYTNQPEPEPEECLTKRDRNVLMKKQSSLQKKELRKSSSNIRSSSNRLQRK